MGPEIGVDPVLRPYRSSTTYRNLKGRREGVFHVTDDVLLLAEAAIGAHRPSSRSRTGPGVAELHPTSSVRWRLLDDRSERARITVETVVQGRIRDFQGFIRAGMPWWKRPSWRPRASILPRARSWPSSALAVLSPDGGPAEEKAFRLLHEHILNTPETIDLDLASARS